MACLTVQLDSWCFFLILSLLRVSSPVRNKKCHQLVGLFPHPYLFFLSPQEDLPLRSGHGRQREHQLRPRAGRAAHGAGRLQCHGAQPQTRHLPLHPLRPAQAHGERRTLLHSTLSTHRHLVTSEWCKLVLPHSGMLVFA